MKPTFLRVGVPKNKAKPPTTVRPPTEADPVSRGADCGEATTVSSTTHTINLPSAALTGDLCLAFVNLETGPVDVGPSGWTEEYSVNANGGSDYAYLYTKTLTSADIAAGSVTYTTVSASADSSNLTHYFRGIDRTDLTISGPVGMDTAEHDPPAVTPSQGAGDYFVVVAFYANKGGFPTDQDTDAPTGYTSWCALTGQGAGALDPDVYTWYAVKSIATSENPSEIGWSDSVGSRSYATVTISAPVQDAVPDVASGDHVHGADSATDGQVWTADGAGSAAWEDPSGGDHGTLTGLADDDHTQYILADGTRAFTGDQSMGSNKLTNVTDPTSAQDAATKAYVDANGGGDYYEVIVSGSSPPVAVTNEAADDWIYGLVP